MEAVLECRKITYTYDTYSLLNQVDLTIASGEYVVLTGENGSGKSTLLQIVIGDKKPTSGEVFLFGEPLAAFHRWEKIGYLGQNAGTKLIGFPANVEEIVSANLYRAVKTSLLSRKQQHEKTHAVLERVGMQKYANYLPRQLSGGQLQRVLLARALVLEPSLLLLDEPTTAMDPQSSFSLYEGLRELHGQGLSILMITHDLGAATGIADKIVHLESGTLSQVAEPLCQCHPHQPV